MDSRDHILAAVRSAIHGAGDPVVTRDHRTELDESDFAEGQDLVDLFVERVDDYRAEVHVVDEADLTLRLGEVLGAHKVKSLVIPPGLEGAWLKTTHARLIRDDPSVTAADLDQVDAVVTGSAVGIAVTGTIVLDASPDQGRRLITLVPDLHVCIVRVDDIVGSVPEAVRRLSPTRPLTWISGPSATSDIELNRVEGVHGPRTLVVLVVR
ncbi:MAG TPA: LUD domain-containing protein [Candidatus Avipropionibacterium avicola]|uniref:LUD domain-containing protein n=1 Tax=Candidatus Avipropionibacterium avicola TaxID=2840701 RepID=A0A9D1GYA1_9ACTN|nr:LUD domain-containing protein [Candidatus Avipropionibacterium avicola]